MSTLLIVGLMTIVFAQIGFLVLRSQARALGLRRAASEAKPKAILPPVAEAEPKADQDDAGTVKARDFHALARSVRKEAASNRVFRTKINNAIIRRQVKSWPGNRQAELPNLKKGTKVVIRVTKDPANISSKPELKKQY